MCFIAYFVGAIPFGYIFAKLHGKDLTKIGSGNIGTTNLSRALSKKWGLICFFCDTLKGTLPILIESSFISKQPSAIELAGCLAVGICAVIGHIYPVYLKFKGGKGVATSFGIALGLYPYLTICAAIVLLIWIVTVLLTKYVSLASIIAAIAFPLILAILIVTIQSWTLKSLWPLMIVSLLIPAMVIIRHKENIMRILKGTENKVMQKE